MLTRDNFHPRTDDDCVVRIKDDSSDNALSFLSQHQCAQSQAGG
jgi:hypothetical protein